VVSRRRDTSWWFCRLRVVTAAQLFATVEVTEDAREGSNRENVVDQQMAEQGDGPEGRRVVALLLEASGTHTNDESTTMTFLS